VPTILARSHDLDRNTKKRLLETALAAMADRHWRETIAKAHSEVLPT
jgi:hypothetical protein